MAPTPCPELEQATRLMEAYSFDLGGYQADTLTKFWQTQLELPASWIRSAVVEALYQGRYKAISVDQILRLWQRRGSPLCHYSHDFDRMVQGVFATVPPTEPEPLSPSPPAPPEDPWEPAPPPSVPLETAFHPSSPIQKFEPRPPNSGFYQRLERIFTDP